MKKFLSIVLLLNVFTALGQQLRPANSTTIYRELKTLKNIPKVLYIAAHPDDENTGLLSWLVNDKNVETAYLSLTRGDGGQNLLGKEQGAALGLIRTYELLEARKMDGAGQYFTRAIDFGFSKNTTDTFKQWDADSLTADAVWVIRQFRPDVIICRFPPTAAAGHGQHAASAVIAEKAFKAAGDPNMFPNQLKHVKIWQAKRIVWNTFRFGSVNDTPVNPDQVKAVAGNYDPLLGLGYGELAGISRSLHKSQGAGTPSTPGLRTEYFTHVAGTKAVQSIFDNINASWTTIGYPDIENTLTGIINNYNFTRPDLSLTPLLNLHKKLSAIKESVTKQEKLRALEKLILSCAGFLGEAVTNMPEIVAGENANFKLNLIARAGVPIILTQVKWLGDVEKVNSQLKNDSLFSVTKQVTIPVNTPITEPYWLTDPAKSTAQFSVQNASMIGLAELPSPLQVQVQLQIGETSLKIDLPLSYKKLDPVKGDLIEPLRILPAINIRFTQPIYFLNNQEELQVGLLLTANKKVAKGTIELKSGSKLLGKFEHSWTNGNSTTVTYSLNKKLLVGVKEISASYTAGGQVFTKDQQLIRYPHLPTLQYFTSASAAVVNGDLKIAAKKIGYLEGAGDLIPDFLREAGLQVEVLSTSEMLNASKLASYEAIVTGVRIVNTEKAFKRIQPALMEYVSKGGTLIMQYNTTQDMAMTNFGPYPFTMSNLRVTEEDSPVRFINPGHRLLTYPNRITAADFEHWVQERGTYFPSNWDDRYEPLFEMHDTGENALRGSTLTTSFGKGHFIYTPLAFFRQLPAGNIGAARLFFNFLSAGK